MQLITLITLTLIGAIGAFSPSVAKFAPKSTTKLFEDFSRDGPQASLGQKRGDPLWGEAQLREFTATYSEDVRFNPLEILVGLFKKPEEAAANSSLAGSLKSTVSLQVLEEKTAAYVKGKIDAKTFKGVLKAAFGDKLDKVLPDIIANLPADKRKL